jgi:predicted transposase YbfD/YdcC
MQAASRQSACSADKGHGRHEVRRLTATTELNDYLDWPGVSQVFVVQRERTVRGETRTETAYGITSLDPRQADASRLLTLVRGHWSIENRLFWVRDMTFGEDQCRVRTGSAPAFLSSCRNLAISLLNRHGRSNKAAALRRHAARPYEALALIRDAPT